MYTNKEIEKDIDYHTTGSKKTHMNRLSKTTEIP